MGDLFGGCVDCVVIVWDCGNFVVDWWCGFVFLVGFGGFCVGDGFGWVFVLLCLVCCVCVMGDVFVVLFGFGDVGVYYLVLFLGWLVG